MTSAAIVGSTGMVGSHILSQLLAHPSYSAIHAFARRDLPNPTSSSKLHPITSTDHSTWATQYPTNPAPSIFYSALGTTRAAAGGPDAQRKIDLDLNYDLARAAKEAGATTYVLVSSQGANAGSSFAYPAMKGELEEKVKALGFKHTVILRPGLIMGTRNESRFAEGVIRGIAGALKSVSPALTDFWGQDASIIARAAVVAGTMCAEGKREEGAWVLAQADIVKLGKEETKN